MVGIPTTRIRSVAQQAATGLLLGSLTWAYTLLALLVAAKVVVRVSGCLELDCLRWFLAAVLTVPVAVALLVALMPFDRRAATLGGFALAVGGLVGAGILPAAGAVPNLLLLSGAGALAATAAAWPASSPDRPPPAPRRDGVVAPCGTDRRGWSVRSWSVHLSTLLQRREDR